ncbi:hypothetical protein [Dorea longicatena]|uniref:hypothetical protein n=1 Tax=Dorea longicatena TaxID=88431 RepID=UPI001FF51C39|nr:hypothetical protein [Dorea longicatena]UOX55223.1 hypothetical protein K5I24_06045 [Dorea longicatena]
MSKYDEANIDKIIKPINIPGINAALSQFAGIYDSKMMKEVSDIARNSILTETQKMFKPLHMESLSMMRNLMTNQTAWMKKYDFTEIKSFTENMSNALGVNNYNIGGAVRALNEMVEPLKISANLLKINEISASISGLSTIMQEAGSASFISQSLKNNSAFSALSEKALENININLLGRVTDQVFSESEEWNIDTVSETIAMEYEKATDISSNKENQNLPITEKRKIDAKEIREWLSFIMTIISFVMGITNSSATTINNYNYTQQVNNYYVVGMGYDVKKLNTTKYRIINRESIVRLKHDCHSIVIEKLEEGQVVRIIDKYKKWRQIIWENEDGEECMGWIQNYKLTEFKIPRNK